MKGKGKRILSGLLSLLTILTSVIQPVITYAAEPETSGYEAQYPALETVREYLDAEEIVTATDYEVETGSSFDVKSDFSGLEINDEKEIQEFPVDELKFKPRKKKVKVSEQELKELQDLEDKKGDSKLND